MYRITLLLTLLALAATGCSSGVNRLAAHDFQGRTVAVMAAVPPMPRVLSGPWSEGWVDLRDPIGTAVRAGTAVAKWEQARRAQSRLDSAAARVDVAEIVARQALRESADLLGYEPVARPTDADYLLDIRVYDYGLVADSYEGATYFALEMDLVVLEGPSRETVWQRRVRERETVDASVFGLPAAAGNVVTARALAQLSEREMAMGLERLAAYAADRATATLRKDFLRSREKNAG